ncbi:MAG: [FeFe] hydrogenase H-cluster maturation GTPase HydF [Bacteroidales bacterium]|nr:[FeFe] hydrogenase H-cluster maturation GTPase HydF [Bacteroidales bacterium]HOY38211.1 [FeFe] hydrogenase H-cluster maturation GTPase HydF [Bacteroidales bacterium]HQP03014.1 [FeFe] hydrogenase H-cluster maturation GTPase HydF [Bacteroidales bacterium]
MSRGKENKPHIGIYGNRNAGKSSLINRIAGQEVSIVSDFAGTTTDPVKKSIEITGFGPVIIIDTGGIDDIGEIGLKRVSKTLHSIASIDLAILVITNNIISESEKKLIYSFKQHDVPFIIVHNKSDLRPLDPTFKTSLKNDYSTDIIEFSTLTDNNLQPLIDAIKNNIPDLSWKIQSLLGDLISYGDIVLLITPIDIEAPEGRMILPQVQAIRDILDNDCIAIVVKEREVDVFLRKTGIKPALAITDSQVFLKADASIPKEIPLTGFSVLLARYKGDFTNYLAGTPKISELRTGDRVLILESCTHHVSCDDIGRVKIPRWMSNYTGKKLDFDVVTGLDKLPRDIRDYALVVQCGGCVLTRKQVINRLRPAVEAGVPVTNYGMAIAWMQGIYKRAVAPFVSLDNKSEYL